MGQSPEGPGAGAGDGRQSPSARKGRAERFWGVTLSERDRESPEDAGRMVRWVLCTAVGRLGELCLLLMISINGSHTLKGEATWNLQDLLHHGQYLWGATPSPVLGQN